MTPRRAWWAVFVFTIALTLNFLDRQLLSLLATPIKRDLGLSDTQFSILVGFMFVLFYLAVGIPISRLVDRGPRKWIIGAGIAFWSLMTAACGMAQNFWQLALARMGVGIGESCNGPATYSMTADMMPREQLGRAISIINIGMVAGQGLALLVGGWLIVQLTALGNTHVPLLGELKPWQLTFLIVGLPGVLWALVLVATVPEPKRPPLPADAPNVPGFGQVLAYVWRWKAAFAPMVAAVGIKSMLSFGTAVWSPSFFERKFGWAPGTPGLSLGLLALIASPIGLVFGGWLADRLVKAGRDEAHMRIVLWASWGVVPFAILFPLMPTPGLALVMLGLSLFFGSMGAGPGNAALQTVTPARMRGTVSALYIAVFNLIGYGLGPLLVAGLTDFGFRDESSLPASLAIAAILLGPLGLLFSRMALRPYAAAVRHAEGR
jgi:MFS family permease